VAETVRERGLHATQYEMKQVDQLLNEMKKQGNYLNNNEKEDLTALLFIAQSVRCLTTDWTTRVRSPAEAKDFSSSLCVQISSGAHPAFYPMGTGGKTRLGSDADHSPPSSAEVRKECELYFLSTLAPAWCVRGRFTFIYKSKFYIPFYTICLFYFMLLTTYVLMSIL
jgi:hypothetical protein